MTISHLSEFVKMGNNCSFKGVVDAECTSSIRVMNDSGRVLEFEYPKLVREVINDFPGYGIFGRGHSSSPLCHHEQLLIGQFYYLLPLAPPGPSGGEAAAEKTKGLEADPVWRSTSGAAMGTVSGNVTKGSGFEVLPPPREGVWSVKLVIGTKELEEILSEEVNIEALIEQMRAAASSAKVAPRRSKSYWGVNFKPFLSKVFNMGIDHGYESKIVRSGDTCASNNL